jgi:hypothetical protein
MFSISIIKSSLLPGGTQPNKDIANKGNAVDTLIALSSFSYAFSFLSDFSPYLASV